MAVTAPTEQTIRCNRCGRQFLTTNPELRLCGYCCSDLSDLLDEDEGSDPGYDFSDGPLLAERSS